MAKVVKRGSTYTAVVYVGKDENGKNQYKRITGPTPEYVYSQLATISNTPTNKLTFREALEQYIHNSESTLSPATIRIYRSYQKKYYSTINKKNILTIDSMDARKLIDSLLEKGIAHKTVKNAYALFTAVMYSFRSVRFEKIRVPKKPDDYERHIPDIEEVQTLIKAAEGSDVQLPIMLAAFGSLRKGECAALLKSDYIGNNTIRVQRTMVRDAEGNIITKYPKTPAGYREVMLPSFVVEKLLAVEGDRIFNGTPEDIYGKFSRILKKTGLPPFRFHDLRHFFASYLHSQGMPDAYIMKLGGWEDASTLQRIYVHALKGKATEEQERAALLFERLVTTM